MKNVFYSSNSLYKCICVHPVCLTVYKLELDISNKTEEQEQTSQMHAQYVWITAIISSGVNCQ